MENSYLNIDYHGISEGSIVAHFKREKNPVDPRQYLYKVLHIGVVDTVTLGQCVVYQALYGDKTIWVRPMIEFFSKVDAKKYPEHAGEWRMRTFY